MRSQEDSIDTMHEHPFSGWTIPLTPPSPPPQINWHTVEYSIRSTFTIFLFL